MRPCAPGTNWTEKMGNCLPKSEEDEGGFRMSLSQNASNPGGEEEEEEDPEVRPCASAR